MEISSNFLPFCEILNMANMCFFRISQLTCKSAESSSKLNIRLASTVKVIRLNYCVSPEFLFNHPSKGTVLFQKRDAILSKNYSWEETAGSKGWLPQVPISVLASAVCVPCKICEHMMSVGDWRGTGYFSLKSGTGQCVAIQEALPCFVFYIVCTVTVVQ